MPAKRDDQDRGEPQQVATGGGMSGDMAAVARAQAEDRAEAERKQLDETVPGGRYEVGGELVNAYGEPIKKGTTAGDLERLRREHELGINLPR